MKRLVEVLIAPCLFFCSFHPSVVDAAVVFTDDFNRQNLGPDWQTCGTVSIVNDALQLSQGGGQTNCISPAQSEAVLVAPGTSLRDGTVQFDLDNGGTGPSNHIFAMGFGSFYVLMNQDSRNDGNPAQRRRVDLFGPSGFLGQATETVIAPGRYEFSVQGSVVRFRNIVGGTAIDLQATDSTPSGPGQLLLYVNEEPASRVDNLVLSTGCAEATATDAAYGLFLFPSLCTQDANGLPGEPGDPYVYATASVGVVRAPADRFYLSSTGNGFTSLAVDDAVHLNGSPSGLGPYQFQPGYEDPPYPLDVPIETILVPLPPHEVTDLVPVGQASAVFELVDTQREIYGNTAVYLVRDCGIWLETGASHQPTIHFISHDVEVGGEPAELSVVTGLLSQLSQDGGFDQAECLGNFTGTTEVTDQRPNPPGGEGYYYLVRGTCSDPSYGDSSLVPDPRDQLDAVDPCFLPPTVFTDDFNRQNLGPDWQTCGTVSIVNDALQLSQGGGQTNCTSPAQSEALLVAPGTSLRDGTVQFDLDNGGTGPSNHIFAMGFGSFYVLMNQDSRNDGNPAQRRRVDLFGPSGFLGQATETVIAPGRYEFSVQGSVVRFRNIVGGTPIDLQATDSTPSGPGQLLVYVNEEPAARVDNLVLTVASP